MVKIWLKFFPDFKHFSGHSIIGEVFNENKPSHIQGFLCNFKIEGDIRISFAKKWSWSPCMKLKVNNFEFSIGADFDASICECCEITWQILCCWVYLLEGCSTNCDI